MHVSLDSALGRQRRLNSVGESVLQIAPNAAAAYSLRSLTGGDPTVVRVRRGSDNHEQDFTASEVSAGALTSFVNAQVVAPLDIQALEADGRTGDFLIAKAAYSLRSLGTRQATVAATGDTVARADGKFVAQVRRSFDDAVKSFTADEITDGTLTDYIAPADVRALYNNAMYFDGVNDTVTLDSEIALAGDFTISLKFIRGTTAQEGLFKSADSTDSLRVLSDSLIFRVSGANTTINFNTDSILANVSHILTITRTSGVISFDINGETSTDTVSSSDTYSIKTFGEVFNLYYEGVIYDININGVASYTGFGTTTWTDQIGSNNGTSAGSPALFTGQGFDGFVKTWYDQSVTNEAGDTATGNHATQATAASQPKIVSAGALVTVGVDFTDGKSMDFTSISAKTVVAVNQLTSTSGFNYLIGKSTADDGVRTGSGNGLFQGADTATTGNADDFNGAGGTTHMNGSQSSFLATSKNVYFGTATSGFSLTSLSTAFAPGGTSRAWKGKIAEAILYDTDQTDNRTAIEANIGEVYSIDLPSGVDPGFDQVDGFVETWYDQSGNGKDATQATAGSQPKIVDGGSLVADGGIAGLDFDGSTSSRSLVASSVSGLEGSLSIFSTSVRDFTGNTVSLSSSSSNSRYFAVQEAGSASVANPRNESSITASDSVSGVDRLTFAVTTGATSTSAGALGSAVTTSTSDYGDNFSGSDLDQIAIGLLRTVSPSGHFNGRIREILVYTSDQTANRSAVETNTSNYYNITLV